MAILAVKVQEESALAMNEFFDYDGTCYGISADRQQAHDRCIEMEDFYEATVRTSQIGPLHVVFAIRDLGSTDTWRVCGWYKDAMVYRDIRRPSLFLEGNILADAGKAVMLPEKMRQYSLNLHFGDKHYEVIEEDDSRYDDLAGYLNIYHGANEMLLLAKANVAKPGSVLQRIRLKPQRIAVCHERCTELARRLMTDNCLDIREIKELLLWSEELMRLDAHQADGFYYHAMACHQLGQTKKGIKAIEKALTMEADASDLKAMKANLLINMSYYEAAAELYHEAWSVEGDEDYLILEGKAWLLARQIDKAFQILGQVSDEALLKEQGIDLKDMERRWPFINVRGKNAKQKASTGHRGKGWMKGERENDHRR